MNAQHSMRSHMVTEPSVWLIANVNAMTDNKAGAAFHPFETMPQRWLIGVEVPWATEVISMNTRSHWTNTHRQTHALRDRGRLTVRAAWPDAPHFDKAACTVYLQFPDKRRRDLQNYHKTLKALLDGFVDAGLLPDDDATHLVGLDVRTYQPGALPEVDRCMVTRSAGAPVLSLVFAFEGSVKP